METLEKLVRIVRTIRDRGSSSTMRRSSGTGRSAIASNHPDDLFTARLRQAERLGRMGYWERDLLTDRITISEGICDIFGMPAHTGPVSTAELEVFIHPADRERVRAALREAPEEKKPLEMDYRIDRGDGSLACVHVREEVEHDDSGRPVRCFGVVQDITERWQAEERLRQSAARTEVLNRVSQALAECQLDVQGELATIADQTMHVIGDGCIIMVLSSDGTTLQAVAQRHRNAEASAALDRALRQIPIRDAVPPDAAKARGATPSTVDAQEAWDASVLRNGTGDLLAIANPTMVKQVLPRALHSFVDQIEIFSLLTVPLRIEQQLLGELALYRTTPGEPYTHDDQVLLQSLGDRAALVIRNAQLFRTIKEGADKLEALSRRLVESQEAERRTLARELHDGIGQTLTLVKLQLEATRQSGQVEEVRARYLDVIRTIDDVLDAVRAMALDLRPAILDDLGLESAVRWYLERQSRGLGLHAHLTHVSLAHRPPPSIELAYYRILQELWTNTLRHAHAHQFAVELLESTDEYVMTVTDDGRGFSVHEAESKALRGQSMGLLNIKERVAQVGGTLSIQSVTGKGTTAIIRTPKSPGREAM